MAVILFGKAAQICQGILMSEKANENPVPELLGCFQLHPPGPGCESKQKLRGGSFLMDQSRVITQIG